MRPGWPLLQQVLSHRLIHFLILGTAAFFLIPQVEQTRVIKVSQEQVDSVLSLAARRQGVKELPPEARDAELKRYFRTEILYREALRLGLDGNDEIIRTRLVQKLLFYAEDVLGEAPPATEATLRDFFQDNWERWIQPPEVRLEHVFLSRAGHLNPAREVETLRRTLLESTGPLDESMGDHFPLTQSKTWWTREGVESEFGESVGEALETLEPGVWSTPILSTYGWHLIRILERRPGRLADFDKVKDNVEMEFRRQGKKAAVDELIRRLEAKYTIEIVSSEEVSLDAVSEKGGQP